MKGCWFGSQLRIYGKLWGMILLVCLILSGCGLEELPQPERLGYSIEEQPNGTYLCRFYGKNHALLRSELSVPIPHVDVLPSGYIKYTVQAGTGTGTLWGFFYDPDNEAFSETFQAILDQKDDLVLCAAAEGIIVRSIFDDSFSQKITHFSREFSPAAECIVDGTFSEKDGVVSVSYYSGADFQIVTEEIEYQALELPRRK